MCKKSYRFFIVIAATLFLTLAACGGENIMNEPADIPPTVEQVETPPPSLAKISPGKWVGTSEFGSFSFLVHQDSTKIVHFTYEIPECGIYAMSGENFMDVDINANSFDLGISKENDFSGTFRRDGVSATGDWFFNPANCLLFGEWEAAPIEE
jgi:hypothetical protein